MTLAHVRAGTGHRPLVLLHGLLGSARELTREAGLLLRREGCAPRLADLVT